MGKRVAARRVRSGVSRHGDQFRFGVVGNLILAIGFVHIGSLARICGSLIMCRILLIMTLVSFGMAARAQPILPPPTGEVLPDSITEEAPPRSDAELPSLSTELTGGADWDQLPQRASR